ncbi:Deoxycytidylate deaminase [Cucumispora dikerogammari]|nr:Deoxycytidylate deaminase [Cucumispora dikerogammari]
MDKDDDKKNNIIGVKLLIHFSDLLLSNNTLKTKIFDTLKKIEFPLPLLPEICLSKDKFDKVQNGIYLIESLKTFVTIKKYNTIKLLILLPDSEIFNFLYSNAIMSSKVDLFPIGDVCDAPLLIKKYVSRLIYNNKNDRQESLTPNIHGLSNNETVIERDFVDFAYSPVLSPVSLDYKQTSDTLGEPDINRPMNALNSICNTEAPPAYTKVAFTPDNIKITKHIQFMKICEAYESQVHCISRSVGAVIVDENNKVLSATSNHNLHQNNHDTKGLSCLKGDCKFCTKQTTDPTKCICFHAEGNAVIDIKDNKNMVIDNTSTLYSTTFPCIQCTKLIIKTGIKKVVFRDFYKQSTKEKSIQLFRNAGVKVLQLKQLYSEPGYELRSVIL